MEIIGVLLIFIMPYMAGYLLKEITRQQATNQLEPYLIGFFFLFFVQGVIFIPAVFLSIPFETADSIMLALFLLILAAFLILLTISFIKSAREKKDPQKAGRWKKEEEILGICAFFVFILVLLRIFWGIGYAREDAMLETVKTTLDTKTMFQYHPLTGQKMEFGMIASKKIVTLPLYYAFLTSFTGLNANVLLYGILPVYTLMTAVGATYLLVSDLVGKNRTKILVFHILLGLLILAGGYQRDIVGYHILYNGYAGETICAVIFIPYMLTLIFRWYHQENAQGSVTVLTRIRYIAKILFLFVTSLFITGIATGFLPLFITAFLAGICCLIKTCKEVRECKE